MAAAIAANDLRPKAIRILMTRHSPGDLVVETWPAAMAVELVIGTIQRRVAMAADESPNIFQVRVFTAERTFRTLVEDYVLFGLGQFVVFLLRLIGIHRWDLVRKLTVFRALRDRNGVFCVTAPRLLREAGLLF